MNIVRKGFSGIAIIDPNKKRGEEGQYVFYVGNWPDLSKIISQAKARRCEIRYYFREVETSGGERVPIKIIVTEIPPGHVQPFHTHEKIHEVSTVDCGEIIAVDSKNLTESDMDGIFSAGEILCEGDMVVEDPGIRHTVANHTSNYARFTTVQSARIPFEQFQEDWK